MNKLDEQAFTPHPEKPIHLYRDYMIHRYGEPLFRIPVDTGRGCPHRGDDARGGCTFCPEHGARAMQIMNHTAIGDQVAAAIQFARRRYLARRYMLYFQAFTSTRNLDEPTRALFEHVRSLAAFDAVSIGTRPDCLSDDTLDFLKAWSKTTDLWVELGVQTMHDATLRRIHRGHDAAASREAILRLHECGIHVAVHVILGLPGESETHFNATAEALAELPVEAIKIHNLHLIRNTKLAAEWAEQAFPVYDEYAYAEILMSFLRRIPCAWPVIRMTTDTPPDELIAPIWHMPKGRFIDCVQEQMIYREWRQGDLVPNAHSADPAPRTEPEPMKVVRTEDGSITLWNADFKEHYHTQAGALLEAEKKYVGPSELETRLTRGPVNLLDICFGMGYNTLAACETAERLVRNPLTATVLEIDRRVIRQSAGLFQQSPDHATWGDRLHAVYADGHFQNALCEIRLRLGDARYTMQQLSPASQDVVFLDAFSTQRNSELWTLDFFRLIRNAMKPDGVLVTYCAALPVRSGLMQAGFFIGETEPVGRQRSGTLACLHPERIGIPLAESEQKEIQETLRGLPYRDPYLVWTNRDILRARQQLVDSGLTPAHSEGISPDPQGKARSNGK